MIHIIRKYKRQGLGLLMLVTMFYATMFLMVSCEQKELDIQQDFPFEVIVMPVPKEIAKGETIEIRIQIKREGIYNDNEYYLRYFQFDGKGILNFANQKPFAPNDLYELQQLQFRLYYTSESAVSQSFDIWFLDSFGNEKMISFQFNSST